MCCSQNFNKQILNLAIEGEKPIPKGLISWKPPPLPPHVSCGAWQNWQYKVIINGTGSSGFSDSQSFSFVPEPDTIYQISVQAISARGDGPLSNYIHSTRFKKTSFNVIAFASFYQ